MKRLQIFKKISLVLIALANLFLFNNCSSGQFHALQNATSGLSSSAPQAGTLRQSNDYSLWTEDAPTTPNINLTSHMLSATKVRVGSSVTATGKITAIKAGDYVIRIEVRDANGNTLSQTSEPQIFTTGETQQFTMSYTFPTSAALGTYYFIFAAFSSDFSTLHFWNQFGLSAVAATSAVPTPYPSDGFIKGQFQLGVNASGMEYGSQFPGAAGTDYALITDSEIDSYQSSHLNLIRLPLSWERLQPTLQAELNTIYLNQIRHILNYASSKSMRVLLDIHNYARYRGNVIGGGQVTAADLADLWKRLASEFKNQAGVGGYDLMNEPNAMPSETVWAESAQDAVNAIRSIDSSVLIYVEGNFYSNAADWNNQNPTFPLQDPSDHIVYSAHAYADHDSSGTHYNWNDEAQLGVNTDTLVDRIRPFALWCEAHRVACHLGETGVGNDNLNWNVSLDKALLFMQNHGIEVTYWAAGPWWGNYAYSIESPTAPQYQVLQKYSH